MMHKSRPAKLATKKDTAVTKSTPSVDRREFHGQKFSGGVPMF
jgi:hypothetical protein